MSKPQGSATGLADSPAIPRTAGDIPTGSAQQALASDSDMSSESSQWRFQKQRPLPTGQRKDGERPLRPSDIAVSSIPQHPANPQTTVEPASPTNQTATAAVAVPAVASGRRPSSPMGGAASPLGGLRSASPRHLSPATSQIFERDVQEPTVAPELSPAIPSHIQTEDHIPPVLEASSKAITDDQLDVDDVEIVMHSQHMPAVVSVAGSTLPDSASQQQQQALPGLAGQLPPTASSGELMVPTHEPEESGSTYGTVDPADPRRLSFISFADVVHAEHVETGKEPSHLVSPVSMAPSTNPPRSPSPIRSPLSDQPPASPPTSGAASPRALEASPVRSGPGSTTSGQGAAGPNELTIETMRQTLQKTGSNELSGQPSTSL